MVLDNTIQKKSFFQLLGLLSLFATLLPQVSWAEDTFDKVEKEVADVLPPNLTVTFNLNSSLPDEETAYYSQIVEELLRNLPRRVELHGENQKLLSDYKGLDHMKVLAYLPTSKEEGLNGERELRYFEVEFFPPKKSRSKSLGDGVNAVVAHKGRYEDFLTKFSDIQEGNVNPIMNVDTAFKQTETGIKSKSLSKEDVQPTKKPETQKKAPSSKAKAKAVSVTSRLELAYFGDELEVTGGDKVKLEKLLKNLKGQKVQNVRVVSKALDGKETSANAISQKRIKALQSLFKKYELEIASEKWSSLAVQAPLFQSLKIEILSSK